MSGALPYTGAPVTAEFRRRWKSGQQIGDIRPVGRIQIRRGVLDRKFHTLAEMKADYPGKQFGLIGGLNTYWYAFWRPTSAWIDIDGLRNVRIDQSFDNNGVATSTILVDNMKVTRQDLGLGPFTTYQKGYYSPLSGFTMPGRPSVASIPQTPFSLGGANQLPNAQIRVWQGLGIDQECVTFLGLVDDLETESVPNAITITSRDFGGVLVDQKVYGWAKERAINDPITFASFSQANRTEKEGGGAQASDTKPGKEAKTVLANNSDAWLSESHPTNGMTWVEIHLPPGTYKSMYFFPEFDNMHAYVGMYLHDGKYNGTQHTESYVGAITVPGGANGGWTAFMEIPATKRKGETIAFPGEFVLKKQGTLRIGFTNLPYTQEIASNGGHIHRAGVRRLAGLKQLQTQQQKDASKNHWIVVDDIADIVRVVLRWAGFKYWEVEDTGAKLPENYIVAKDKSFMDIINDMKSLTGFTFFIAEPLNDSDDADLGRPIFRRNRIIEQTQAYVEQVTDEDMLTDTKSKWDNTDERTIIRTRGKSVSNGVGLFGDNSKTVMYSLLPPWYREMAGVIKHLTHYDNKIATLAEAEMSSILIALQIALAKHTAVVSIPAHPGIGLDTLIYLIDRPQGLNGRMYVSNRSSEMQLGTDGYWHMDLGGALIDTPDLLGVVLLYLNAIKNLDLNDRPVRKRKRGKKAGKAAGSNIPGATY